MNEISEITRRNIFDNLTISNISWSGRLEETEFLSRMFNLSKLSSSDYRFKTASGDIWQHRVMNRDWDEDWVYTDTRFNLLYCEDSIFLQFLCEMVHPVVRTELLEIKTLVQLFNTHLASDGFEVIEKTKISDKPVFSAKKILKTNDLVLKRSSEIINVLSADYVAQKITRMEAAIDTDPSLAIGTAKELIEMICKTILKKRNKKMDDNWDTPKLLKETAKELKLTPGDISEKAKAFETIKSILGSLTAVVHGICELRNNYGTGHGKDIEFRGLSPRHAKLAVGAASTLAIFLLETHEIRE